jgi:hypothetical protein
MKGLDLDQAMVKRVVPFLTMDGVVFCRVTGCLIALAISRNTSLGERACSRKRSAGHLYVMCWRHHEQARSQGDLAVLEIGV